MNIFYYLFEHYFTLIIFHIISIILNFLLKNKLLYFFIFLYFINNYKFIVLIKFKKNK